MLHSQKRKIIAGNWKMHKTIGEARHYIDLLSKIKADPNYKILLGVPFTALPAAVEAAAGSNIEIGAQNISEHAEGAYTGEVSAHMVKDAGAEFVIIGHSERRQHFHESNDIVHAKIRRALAEKLQPLVCVGETLEQRKEGHTESILAEQIHSALSGLTAKEGSQLMIAYEPIWAIGTGLVAELEKIEAVHRFCRRQVSDLLSDEVGFQFKILYGGSVNASNAASLLESDEIDGVLVGSASLNIDSFSKIVNNPKRT